MNDKGLYAKYHVYTYDNVGFKAVKGFCFVLKPESDPAAWVALRAYIEATDNKRLADDLAAVLEGFEEDTDG